MRNQRSAFSIQPASQLGAVLTSILPSQATQRQMAIGSWQLAKPKEQNRRAESAKTGQMERKP
jgi:hypothetical protein